MFLEPTRVNQGAKYRLHEMLGIDLEMERMEDDLPQR